MIKHTALLGTLVVLLVGGLVYCISPGEVETIWTVARSRVLTEASGMLEATLHSETHAMDQAGGEPAAPRVGRDNTPDSFRPFGPGETSGASRLSDWLKGPQPVAVWVSMVVVLLAYRYVRRRRFKLAMEQKWRPPLSKGVRQM